MKKNLKLLSILLFISFFSSCSKDEINQNSELLGVWERSDHSANSTNTYRLVFGPNNTGLRIHSNVFDSGEVISVATSFDWNLNDNKVRLSENDIFEDIYLINSDGKQVLSTEDDLLLDKVSNDYSPYY
ncbi:MAG TPA: hypothetical protein VGA80_13120 [Flavobacteriaceae bacterium]